MRMVNLSVIMPGYNPKNEEIEIALRSILSSLGQDGELIYVDDKSPRHPKVVDEIANNDTRVKVIHLKENHGQAYARNVGIMESRGRFVTFADQDDEVVAGWYNEGVSLLDEHDADIVVCGVRTIWRGESLRKEDRVGDKCYGVIDAAGVLELYRNCLLNYPWNKIYRRSFLESNRIRFEEKSVPREDEVFNLKCMCAHARVVAANRIGYVYNHYAMSTLGRYRKYNNESREFVTQGWNACRLALNDGNCVLKGIGQYSDGQIFMQRWQNIWRPQAPYSLCGRWHWLTENSTFCWLARIGIYLRMIIYQIGRRFLYVRLVRRWHVRRMYSNAHSL